MIKVKVTFPYLNWPIERQLPSRSNVFDNCQFYINEEVKECDYWFVYGDLSEIDSSVCPEGNTVLITCEPPSIKTYAPAFVSQFDAVITSQRKIKKYHKNVIFSQQAFPWHVGRIYRENGIDSFDKDYSQLKSIKKINKNKIISVLSSNKVETRGHKKRLLFVRKLKDYFGDQIDIYGRGINPINDKWGAIAPYKYHVVIENDYIDDYWTEKLADVYLAGAFPFYYGCPNLNNYFPNDSYRPIDIGNFEQSILTIEHDLKNSKWETSYPSIIESRKLVLDKYNLFATISRYCNEDKKKDGLRNKISLAPERFRVNSDMISNLRSKGWGLISGHKDRNK